MKSRHGMPRRAACGALIRRSAITCNDFPPGSYPPRAPPPVGQGGGTTTDAGSSKRLPRTRRTGRGAAGSAPRLAGLLRARPRLKATTPVRLSARALARCQHHHHLAAFHARLRFDLGERLRIGLDALQDLPAEFLMGELTTAKAQRDLDLVAIVEEALHGAHFHVIVMIVDTWAHFDLFDLDDLLPLARLGGLFLLLIFVFAVVQHLGHRWVGVGRNLNQIEARRRGTRE